MHDRGPFWQRLAPGLTQCRPYDPLVRLAKGVVLLPAVALALATGAGVTPAAAAPAPACAAAGNCQFTRVMDLHRTVLDGPARATPVDIEYDLYLPAVATPASPQPGIVHFNGLGGGNDDAAAVATSGFMARHGYVVLAFTSQGNGDPGNGTSGGVLELEAPEYDVVVAKAMVDILDARKDVLHDARGAVIGTTGGSYGGAPQELLAEVDPRIRAITPWRTFWNPEFSLAPNNLGADFDIMSKAPGVLKVRSAAPAALGWMDAILVRGFQLGAEHNDVGACPGWDPKVCTLYGEAVANGQATADGIATVRHSAPATWVDPLPAGPVDPPGGRRGLRVPTMLVEGEHDFLFTTDEAVAAYTALKARGVPVELVWNYGGHGYDGPGTGGGTGEGDLQGTDTTNPDGKPLPRRMLAWLDRWLRGEPVDTGPEFSYYRDWVTYNHADATPAYGYAPAFPAEASQRLPLVAGDPVNGGSLGAPGSAPPSGSVTIVNPGAAGPASFTEQPNFQAPDATVPAGPNPYPSLPPSDPPGEVAVFTSDPLARDLVSVGIPTVHLHLSSVAGRPEATLFAKLFDVAPDGTSVMVPRDAAPSRIPLSGATTADIKLLGFAHLFKQGHRVQLRLATTDAAMTADRTPDSLTLTTGGVDAAALNLPVDAAGVGVIAPPASTGGLPNTGARRPAPGLSLLALAASLAAAVLGMRGRRRGRSSASPTSPSASG